MREEEEAPSLSLQEGMFCLGFLLALCVCRDDISQHIAEIQDCVMNEDLGSKKQLETRPSSNSNAQFINLHRDLCVGV